MRNLNEISRPAICKATTLSGNPCQYRCHGLGMNNGDIVYLPVCRLHGTKRFRNGKLLNPGRYNLSSETEQKIVDLMTAWVEDINEARTITRSARRDTSTPSLIGGLTFSQFHRVCTAVIKVLPYEISYQNCTEEEVELKCQIYAALQEALENVVLSDTGMYAVTRRAIEDGRALEFKRPKG